MKEIEVFKKVIHQRAPSVSGIKNKGKVNKTRMPYKPALMFSLFWELKTELNNKGSECINNLFNTWLDFREYQPGTIEYKIIKRYHEILVEDNEIYETLKEYADKKIKYAIELVFNERIYKTLVNHSFELPFDRMADGLLKQNVDLINIQKPKKLMIKYSGNDIMKFLDELIDISYKELQNSNIGYENISLKYAIDYDSYVMNEIISENPEHSITGVKKRKYQHWWAKQIKQADTKCVVCCEQTPCLLQAAHIKPYSKCSSMSEQYDLNNGITLCLNHHKLFDQGYFTFLEDWKVEVSKDSEFRYYKKDLDLEIKRFESCSVELIKRKSNIENNYRKYHYENIFKRINN